MGRLAVITGSSGGIGSATLRAFKAAGWTTLGVDVSCDSSEADRHVQVDLAAENVGDELGLMLAGFGKVDAVINNAAIQIAMSLIDTTPEQWRQVFDVNVIGAAMLIQAAVPHMGSGGAIVNIGSVHSVVTSPGLAAYVTSKGAIAAMTRAAALELACKGIRVNCVLPGAVDTSMLRQGLSRVASSEAEVDASLSALAERTPLGRVGRPEDIAQAILFLADTTRSGFITGQTLVVDGGASARLSTE